MYYIDSNIFIYPMIYDPASVEEAAHARGFLLEIALGKIEAYASPITWDEVAWVVRKILGVDISLKQGRKFLDFPNLKILPVKRTTALKAQDLMEEYELKPRDALHAAIALENKITTIVSYDEDFDKIKVLKRIEP
ncbi:MAG: type II toxin-antitoxin system VapC family toxin [Crenarchaeota archaeon]|nr:type II toxin-antitoxin system VapC family toxin [Thermoproteota archaeon]MDW8034023.1 type II toxin-antitoxin system VapC family toxin [Nitrososphaerota archaeon]